MFSLNANKVEEAEEERGLARSASKQGSFYSPRGTSPLRGGSFYDARNSPTFKGTSPRQAAPKGSFYSSHSEKASFYHGTKVEVSFLYVYRSVYTFMFRAPHNPYPLILFTLFCWLVFTYAATHTETMLDNENEEAAALSNFVNIILLNDEMLTDILPLDCESDDIYEKCQDGLIMVRLLNTGRPGCIDESTIHREDKMNIFEKNENLNKVIKTASSIGCHVINIGSQDILEGRQIPILGLMWQLVRLVLLSKVTAKNVKLPEFMAAAAAGRTLPPEMLLLKWLNHFVVKAGLPKVRNFGSDVTDPNILCALLNQLDAELCPLPPANCSPILAARTAIWNLQSLGCITFAQPKDLCSGNPRLIMGFVAQVFNTKMDVDDEEREVVVERARAITAGHLKEREAFMEEEEEEEGLDDDVIASGAEKSAGPADNADLYKAMAGADDVNPVGTSVKEGTATAMTIAVNEGALFGNGSRDPFFITKKPKDTFEGIVNSQYNIAKGIVAAPVLLVTSPFVEASDSFNKSDTTAEGVINGATGFGGGLVRGVVGAPLIMLTGLATGVQQVVMAAIDTGGEEAPASDATFMDSVKEDFTRLNADPLTELVLPEGMAGKEVLDPANCVIDALDTADIKEPEEAPKPEPNSQPVFRTVSVK
jgi:hypothetical protein